MSLSLVNAGMNITSEKLQLTEVSCQDERFVLENIDEEFFEEILDFNEKETKVINILQTAFDELILRTPLNSDSISITLPPNKFKTFEIPFEVSLSRKDLKQHIKWEFTQLFPDEDENAFLIREIKIVNSNLRIAPTLILLAVRKNYLEILHKFCLRNKLKLKIVDHAHLAAANIFRGLRNAADQLNLSLYLSDKSFSVMLLDNNYPVYFKNYSIDKAIEVIEKLKIAVELIEKIGIPLPENKKGYIAGDNITDTLLTQIKDEVNITFLKLNPFTVIKTNPDLEEKELYNRKYNSFSASTGIAFRLS